ncbi:MAG: hypothetical protein ACRENL_07630 [Candidatus Dormibacteria bacterium]
MSTTLRAEFHEEDEANNWHYRVPARHIHGGGTRTREEAERECLEAIAFALQGDPSAYDSEAVAVTLDVSVAPPPDRTDVRATPGWPYHQLRRI